MSELFEDETNQTNINSTCGTNNASSLESLSSSFLHLPHFQAVSILLIFLFISLLVFFVQLNQLNTIVNSAHLEYKKLMSDRNDYDVFAADVADRIASKFKVIGNFESNYLDSLLRTMRLISESSIYRDGVLGDKEPLIFIADYKMEELSILYDRYYILQKAKTLKDILKSVLSLSEQDNILQQVVVPKTFKIDHYTQHESVCFVVTKVSIPKVSLMRKALDFCAMRYEFGDSDLKSSCLLILEKVRPSDDPVSASHIMSLLQRAFAYLVIKCRLSKDDIRKLQEKGILKIILGGGATNDVRLNDVRDRLISMIDFESIEQRFNVYNNELVKTFTEPSLIRVSLDEVRYNPKSPSVEASIKKGGTNNG